MLLLRVSCDLPLSPTGEPQDTWLGASSMRSSKAGPASTQACHRFPGPGLPWAWARRSAGEASHPAWSMAEQGRETRPQTPTLECAGGGSTFQGPS